MKTAKQLIEEVVEGKSVRSLNEAPGDPASNLSETIQSFIEERPKKATVLNVVKQLLKDGDVSRKSLVTAYEVMDIILEGIID